VKHCPTTYFGISFSQKVIKLVSFRRKTVSMVSIFANIHHAHSRTREILRHYRIFLAK